MAISRTPRGLKFIYADLGNAKAISFFWSLITQCLPLPYIYMLMRFFCLTNNQVNIIFSENAFDVVMHFVVVAYVGVMVWAQWSHSGKGLSYACNALVYHWASWVRCGPRRWLPKSGAWAQRGRRRASWGGDKFSHAVARARCLGRHRHGEGWGAGGWCLQDDWSREWVGYEAREEELGRSNSHYGCTIHDKV